MRVLDSQAPAAEHHQPGHRKQHAREPGGLRLCRRVEAWGQDVGEDRRRRDTGQREERNGQQQQPKHRVRESPCRLWIVAPEHTAVNRHERRGQRSLAQQIPHGIRNFERRVVGVRGGSRSEVVREYGVAQQPDNSADEDPRANDERGASAPDVTHDSARVPCTSACACGRDAS